MSGTKAQITTLDLDLTRHTFTSHNQNSFYYANTMRFP
jgi:hypothetical protein